MEWSTHMLSGVVAGYAITGGDYKGAILGGIAGIVPDLDEPKSKFGKVFFPVSYPLNSLVGHRTFTHSLLFIVMLGAIFSVFTEMWIALAVMSGVLAHILGDMLTGTVRFLYPLNTKIGIRINFAYFKLIDRVTRLALIALIVFFGIKEFKSIF